MQDKTRAGLWPLIEQHKKAADPRVALFLTPLEYVLLKEGGTPIPAAVSQAYAACQTRNAMLEAEQTRLKALLSKENIPGLFYKGVDLEKRFYGPLGGRPFRDMDLLVAREDMERAGKTLTQAGYAFTWRTHYHDQYKKGDYIVELHSALCSYKYRLLFDLDRVLDATAILAAGSLTNEQYLLLSLLEIYNEFGTRPTPFADLFMIVEQGINPVILEKLFAGCDAAFLWGYCHYKLLHLTGRSPLDNLLPGLLLPGQKKSLEKLAQSARKRSDTYKTAFFMASHKAKILRGLFWPPEDVIKVKDKSRFAYWLRYLRFAAE